MQLVVILTTKPYSHCYAPKFTKTMNNTIYKVSCCVYLTFPQIFSLRQDCTISSMYNKFPPHYLLSEDLLHWAMHEVRG